MGIGLHSEWSICIFKHLLNFVYSILVKATTPKGRNRTGLLPLNVIVLSAIKGLNVSWNVGLSSFRITLFQLCSLRRITVPSKLDLLIQRMICPSGHTGSGFTLPRTNVRNSGVLYNIPCTSDLFPLRIITSKAFEAAYVAGVVEGFQCSWFIIHLITLLLCFTFESSTLV